MPAGAPTKYTDDVPKKLIEFFDRDFFVEINGKTMPNKLPTFERFTYDIGITVSTWNSWIKKYPELSKAYEKAKALQVEMLSQMVLMGFYKENFAKFLMLNKIDLLNLKPESKIANEQLKQTIENEQKRLVIAPPIKKAVND